MQSAANSPYCDIVMFSPSTSLSFFQHCATSWIYDSVYSAYMLNIHTNIHMLYAKNTHWYILRIEPESHVVYFAYTRCYHVRLLWVC